jgi:hypothetical protein
MSNELPHELKIQREIDRIVDAIIALLSREEQTKIIRKAGKDLYRDHATRGEKRGVREGMRSGRGRHGM